MIGYLQGKVVFSDGQEIIVLTNDGVGYQGYFSGVAAEDALISLYTTQVFRENSQEIYCFKHLRDKKAFELMLTVNGVGPKSAYSLVKTLGCEALIDAVILENKNLLKEAPGIGLKSASQIILDLKEKIKNLKMYSEESNTLSDIRVLKNNGNKELGTDILLQETLQACAGLGFKESQILPLAKKILGETKILKSEQLLHLVLKQIG